MSKQTYSTPTKLTPDIQQQRQAYSESHVQSLQIQNNMLKQKLARCEQRLNQVQTQLIKILQQDYININIEAKKSKKTEQKLINRICQQIYGNSQGVRTCEDYHSYMEMSMHKFKQQNELMRRQLRRLQRVNKILHRNFDVQKKQYIHTIGHLQMQLDQYRLANPSMRIGRNVNTNLSRHSNPNLHFNRNPNLNKYTNSRSSFYSNIDHNINVNMDMEGWYEVVDGIQQQICDLRLQRESTESLLSGIEKKIQNLKMHKGNKSTLSINRHKNYNKDDLHNKVKTLNDFNYRTQRLHENRQNKQYDNLNIFEGKRMNKHKKQISQTYHKQDRVNSNMYWNDNPNLQMSAQGDEKVIKLKNQFKNALYSNYKYQSSRKSISFQTKHAIDEQPINPQNTYNLMQAHIIGKKTNETGYQNKQDGQIKS